MLSLSLKKYLGCVLDQLKKPAGKHFTVKKASRAEIYHIIEAWMVRKSKTHCILARYNAVLILVQPVQTRYNARYEV
jgi:hypothetical protein